MRLNNIYLRDYFLFCMIPYNPLCRYIIIRSTAIVQACTCIFKAVDSNYGFEKQKRTFGAF